jgi:hypothetical protein
MRIGRLAGPYDSKRKHKSCDRRYLADRSELTVENDEDGGYDRRVSKPLTTQTYSNFLENSFEA